MLDAVIVGGGPGGVSCATWLKQLGFDVELVEKQPRCGGLQNSNPYINSWIPTSVAMSGADVATSLHNSMLERKVPMHLSTEVKTAAAISGGWGLALSNGKELLGRNVVLATGVVPKAAGFIARAGIIVGSGKAVASTDFSGAHIAILGGGDNAFENYTFAKERGAESVTIFARSIRARADLRALVPTCDVVVGKYVVAEDANQVNGQRFDQILVLYGYEVPNAALLGLQLTRRADGYVWTDADCMTNLTGVFAIGEVAHRAHPCCLTSMADGVVAAKAIQRRIEASPHLQIMGLLKRSISSAKGLLVGK